MFYRQIKKLTEFGFKDPIGEKVRKYKGEEKMSEEKNRPIARLQSGALSLSVWQKNTEKDGKKYSFNNYQLQRCYKDGDEFKYTDSLRESDLLAAAELLRAAHNRFAMDAQE